MFVYHVDGELLEEIRANTNKGMTVGHDRFKEEIEKLTGGRVNTKKARKLLPLNLWTVASRKLDQLDSISALNGTKRNHLMLK